MVEKRNVYHKQDYDVPFRHPKKLHARAIYDNIADTPEELAFKKGEILNVIEQDPDGLIGWWLCSLRGRQGICPGNRLRIVNSYDSGCFTPSPSSSPSPSLGASSASFSSSDLYDTSTLRSVKRRSWYHSPNKVITPHKIGDVYSYDISPSSRNSPYQNISIMSDLEAYDIPRPAATIQMNYDCPKPHVKEQLHRQLQQDDSYDTPRPATSLSQQNMTPSSSNSSLMTPDNQSLSSSNRSSLAMIPDYDIPRRNPTPVRTTTPQQPSSLSNYSDSTYDYPQQSLKSAAMGNGQDKNVLPVTKELPLELGSALDTLAKLQTEANTAVTRLLAFAVPNYRTREKLEPVLMDIKLAAVRLKTALHDLAEFGEGTLGNATRSDDKSLAHKLRPLVKALRDADKLIHDISKSLEERGWTLDNLSRKDQNVCTIQPRDDLDQLIACAQTLTEDVRLSASFIQGNATLLFKRFPPTPTNPPNNGGSIGEWIEDNDYVSLESKDAADKKNFEFREAMPSNLKKKFDSSMKAVEDAAINADKLELNPNDKLLIKYYALQISTHMGYLTQAIDSFLETVEKNQPPKFFIAYGKFVVLSAHNLVSIGDIIHRNISKEDIKMQVQKCTDGLSDGLRVCVQKSKKAAQQFPSVNAVQEMVDSVVDISHLAYDLKVAVLQSVQI